MLTEIETRNLPEPTSSFARLGLSPALVGALEWLGFTVATPVQTAAVPVILAGQDAQVRAETGSGKTLAYSAPLLERLLQESPLPIQRTNPVTVLIVVPTRELAVQIADVLSSLVRALGIPQKVLAVYGGVKINPQMMALRGGVAMLVATPGRLLELHQKNAVVLGQVRTLVLDEADRLLSLGFQEELTQLLSLLPKRRQNLLFSATFPEALAKAIQGLLRDPAAIDLVQQTTPQLIEQRVYTVAPARKTALLIHLIGQRDLRQVLVFVSSKQCANGLLSKLQRAKLDAAVFHGDKSQSERQRGLTEFRNGRVRILIATDLAARGLDIEDLPCVVNFELPRSPSDFVHRTGRTGRAGKSGLALSLICPEDYHHFSVIEKRLKQRFVREQVPSFEAP